MMLSAPRRLVSDLTDFDQQGPTGAYRSLGDTRLLLPEKTLAGQRLHQPALTSAISFRGTDHTWRRHRCWRIFPWRC